MQDERKRILNMVKEGKLTIDEALTLFDELDKTKDTMKKKEEAMIQELSTVVDFEDTKKENIVTNKKVQSTKDKIFDFIDMTIKKIKDFDLDWNFGKYEEISHIFQTSDACLKEMDIDIANGSVKMISWDQNDVRVECEAKVYRVNSLDEARMKFLNEVIFTIDGDKMKFISQQKWLKINTTIYVPQRDYEDVRIRLFNGSIEGEQLNMKSCKAKTVNGKVHFSKVNSQYTELETVNGHIDVHNGSIEEFGGETIHGAISLDGFFKRVDVQSLNGSITCSFYNADGERFDAEAFSGAVKLYVPHQTDLWGEIKSNLGSVHVDRDNIQVTEEKNEVIQKLLKFQPIDENENALKVKVETKSGSINIKKGI